jgi:hypothetical protein
VYDGQVGRLLQAPAVNGPELGGIGPERDSMTGLIVPASARAAIARGCAPLAFMNKKGAFRCGPFAPSC